MLMIFIYAPVAAASPAMPSALCCYSERRDADDAATRHAASAIPLRYHATPPLILMSRHALLKSAFDFSLRLPLLSRAATPSREMLDITCLCLFAAIILPCFAIRCFTLFRHVCYACCYLLLLPFRLMLLMPCCRLYYFIDAACCRRHKMLLTTFR